MSIPEALLNKPRSKPLAISHRGAHDTFPENSIPAFLLAIEQGADGIELDVHATSDGVVVVHHDPVLHAEGVPQSRETRIDSISARDLKRLELAPGIPIPTLAESLAAIGSSASVFVEVKAPNIEALVVRCVRESDAICAIHSFDHRTVLSVKKLFPAVRCGVLETSRHIDPAVALHSSRADDLWQHVDYVDAELVSQVQSVGARVIAWTANDAAQWQRLRELGVDGICTDRIAPLSAQLR